MSARPAPESMPCHAIESGLGTIRSTFSTMISISTEGLADDRLAEICRETQRVVAQAQELAMRVAHEADFRETSRGAGATSTSAMIAASFGGDRKTADRMLRTARDLSAQASATQTAMASGDVSLSQARIIAKTMTALPPSVTSEQREAAETTLIDDAQHLTLRDFERRALRISDVFAEPSEVDASEGATLEARERHARRKANFWMVPVGDGTVKGGFCIPEMDADMLRTAVEAISAPRRDALQHGAVGHDGTGDKDLTYGQRMGLGFMELIEHLPSDRLPSSGGVGATMTVNFDFDQLVTGIGAATLTTGTRISMKEARRMACHLELIPMVFGGKPYPMDLGYRRRLFSREQRIALAQRDGGCAFPGCDRPPQWCEGHHAKEPWASGKGKTDIDEGVLVCARHHHVIHDDGWQVKLGDDGYPVFIPPRNVDRTQKPQRNTRWRAPRLGERKDAA